uniref:Uncharacterized protein n=1 Tax=Moniliophthora roreri TaxID=221103 RepID=A0A0W0G9T7_MONRR
MARNSGIPSALEDLWAWTEYYDAPLKNCAIALGWFRNKPHEERRSFLYMCICHEGQMNIPIQHRFDVVSVSRVSFEELPNMVQLCGMGPSGREKLENMVRLEHGNDFYGVQSYVVQGEFNGYIFPWPKQFSLDKNMARANVLRPQWWMLLRGYVSAGAKVKFCCGKLGGEFSDVCCCGGWTHDKHKLVHI